ncbi:flagellar basal body rod protein FlgB [Allosphingosinicella sp.]|jgi:flagellar basal-body rod protein FlgB|uniref:flagellar basal body rod protein FlgB n=1 Tax=Allosphingosinicella sp. TaxID=2823234 RepID=UPI002EE5B887
MDAFSAAVMIRALDSLAERSVATAANIANAGSPNYRPVRVSFESALAEAASRGPAAIREFRPSVEADPTAGDGVRIDLELATAAATAGRYAALIDLLGRQLQIEALAVTGGR